MRSLYWVFASLLALQVAHCRGPDETRYQAPRRPRESVLSWADASSGASSTGECPDGEVECNSFYLGKKEHQEGMVHSAKTFYDYVALLDFDYDPTPVSLTPTQPPSTRLEVRQVLEEYVNLLPGGTWDEVVVAATCDKNGHCLMNEGRLPMPLWSGVNLVFGRLLGCKEPRIVTIPFDVFAVEGDLLYDYFGFGYDWKPLRDALKNAGEEAAKTRPLACTPQPTIPPSPPSDEGGPDAGGPIPLPDP